MRRRLFSTQTPAPGAIPTLDPDATLVARAVIDRDAFGVLFDRHWEPIFKYCYAHTGDWHVAEDAASEIFLKALANIGNYDPTVPGTSFRSWLFGIARHVIATGQRNAARRPQTPLEGAIELRDPGETLEDQVLATEEHEQLRNLLDQLPDNERELLELRMAGLSAVEIGRVMGRSQEAVRKAQSRSVISLRNALRQQNETTDGYRHG